MIKQKSTWSLLGLMWLAPAGLAICLLTLLHGRMAVGASGETLYIQTDTAAVRTAPSEDAEVLLSLSKGDKVIEFRRQGNWVKVAIFGRIGKEGWVRDALLGKTLPGKAPSSLSEDLSAPPETQSKPLRADKPEQQVRKAGGPKFTLVVAGVPQRFKALCRLIDRKGVTRKIRFKGRKRTSFALDGRAVRCKVDKVDQRGGLLNVALYERGRSLPVGANQTRAAFGCVRVRSDGPWGRAYGRRCSRVAR